MFPELESQPGELMDQFRCGGTGQIKQQFRIIKWE